MKFFLISFFLGFHFLYSGARSHAESLADQWKNQYLNAIESQKRQPDISCQSLTELSKQKNFPLRKLALLRAFAICKSQSPTTWKGLKNYLSESWIQKELHRERLQWLQVNKLYFQAYQWHQNNPQYFELPTTDKIELSLKAMTQAPGAKERKAIENNLHKLSPKLIPSPKTKDFFKIAKDFRTARDFKKALEYYQKILKSKKFNKIEKSNAHKEIRRTYKLNKQTQQKEYIQAAKNWAEYLNRDYKKSKKLTRLHHNANVAYIRTLWTEQGKKTALPVLKKLKKQMQKRYSLQTLYWLEAKIAEEDRNFVQTVALLKQAEKAPSPSDKESTRILWNLAWNLRRIGKFSESSNYLKKLLKKSDLTFYTKTKYLFWTAKNFEDAKEKKESLQRMEKLAKLDTFGFYGALALRSLKKPFPPLESKEFLDKDLAKLFITPGDFAIFQWLIDLKEYSVAQEVLKTRLKAKRHWSYEDWARSLKLLQKSHAFMDFFIRINSLKPKLQMYVQKKYPSLHFPRPYSEIVKKSAQESSVPEALIYSIMKQESGFDPRARSFADAFGLMQLLPRVAKKAQSFNKNIPFQDANDLFIPKVNIPLGALTIKNLLNHFKQQLLLSIAAYNSSRFAAKRWVKSRYNGDPLTFIEDIPYAETKGYVKLVLRNFISYQRFSQNDQLSFFPESCLADLQKAIQ